MNEFFWWLLMGACMVWYCTVTIYVGIRGAFDIKSMLARLSGNSAETDQTDSET